MATLKVRSIALKVRKLIEDTAKHYNYDFFDKNLGCACAVSSFLLHKELKKNKIKSKFVWGFFNNWPHCWNVIDNSILDITATQFGESDSVYLTDLEDDRYVAHLFDKDAVKSLYNWPFEQNPKNYKMFNGKLRLKVE